VKWAEVKERYPALAATLPGWALARILVIAAAIGAEFLFYDGRSLGHALVGHEHGLMSWDADWYLRIARDGYQALPIEGIRYFPLYPIAARVLSLGSDHWTPAALLLLANVFAVLLGLLVYRLCMFEKQDPDLARRSAWLVAVAPPAFVLVMAYTEALAMTFAVGAFLAIRRKSWFLAAIAGFLAGLVRPTGLLLLVPIAIEAWRDLRPVTFKKLLPRVTALASPLLGTAVYLLWSAQARGDALLPLRVQQRSNARGRFQDPLLTFWHAARDLVTDARVDQGLHLVWVALFVYLIYVTFRHWPASYGAFATVSLLQAVGTDNLNSLERYCYGAFPVILAIAYVCRTKSAERWLLAVSAVAMTGYAAAAFVSGYVP
jgi:hypothetical protein